jgi:hypothetical protein
LPAEVSFVNGKASFSVTFATPGAQSLTLTDDADKTITATAPTTVMTAPSPTPIPTPVAATQLALMLPSTVPSGVPVLVEAMAQDASGNLVPSYDGTPTLSIANGSATLIANAALGGSTTSSGTLPASITFNNGRAVFALVFTESGTPTLTLTDSTNNISGTAQVTVAAPSPIPVPTPIPTPIPTPTPAAPVQLALFLPSTTVPEGVSVMVQAMAEDAYGNPVPSYTGTASLTSTDSAATSGGVALPVNVTFTNGQASIPVTFATTGSQTLTLTDKADSLAGSLTVTVAAVTVPTPGPIPLPPPTPILPPITQEQFAIMLPPMAPSGVQITVHAVAVGPTSAVSAVGYSGTAILSSTDGKATSGGQNLPVSVTFTNGQASFPVTFGTGGTQWLTLTSSDKSITGTASTMVVTPIPTPPPVTAPAQFQLQLPPTMGPQNGVAENTLVIIKATAEDANGNPVAFNGTATLSISGGTAIFGYPQMPGPVFLLPVDVTFVNGQAQLPLTFTSVGTDVLTLTDDLNQQVTGSLTVTVLGPPPSTGPGSTNSAG